MPVDYTLLPLQPPEPLPADATKEDRLAWLDQHRIVAMYAQAEASTASAAAQRETATTNARMAEAAAGLTAPRRYSRADVALTLARQIPQITGMTEAGTADLVKRLVDAMAAKFPGLITEAIQ